MWQHHKEHNQPAVLGPGSTHFSLEHLSVKRGSQEIRIKLPGTCGVLGPQLAWEKPAKVSVLLLICTPHERLDPRALLTPPAMPS